jgi:uridine phosphorylase
MWDVTGTCKVNGKTEKYSDTVPAKSANDAKKVAEKRLYAKSDRRVKYSNLVVTSVREA